MKPSVNVVEVNLNNPAEAKEVIHLLSSYAMDPMGGGKDLSAEVKEMLPGEIARRPNSVVLVAYVGNEAVGLTIAFEGFSTFYAKPLINIHDFVVLGNYRGMGIAKLMLEKIEQIAKGRGCCKLTLEVLEGNKRAQHVYQSFGFEGYALKPEVGNALFWDKKL